jgi:hypothetical protein
MKTGAFGKFIVQLQTIGVNFSPLRMKNIRIYMFGQTVNLPGDRMQQTAQAWVGWELTHKITALGIVASYPRSRFLFLVHGAGVFSDRQLTKMR